MVGTWRPGTLLVVAGLAAVVLTGCDGPGRSAPAAASPDATASASVGGASISCRQITREQVQPLMAGRIDKVTVAAIGENGNGQRCVYAGGDDDESDIEIDTLSGAFATQAYAKEASDPSKIALAGVGDQAVRSRGDAQLDALQGDRLCAVSLGSLGDLPGVGEYERAHGGRSTIPDAAAEAGAKALGTLCNRIYGSGDTTPDLAALKAALGAS